MGRGKEEGGQLQPRREGSDGQVGEMLEVLATDGWKLDGSGVRGGRKKKKAGWILKAMKERRNSEAVVTVSRGSSFFLMSDVIEKWAYMKAYVIYDFALEMA